MTEDRRYFGLTAWDFSHQIMLVMREVMKEIRALRGRAVTEKKGLTGSGKTDYVTEADRKGQAMYVGRFQRIFPGVGFIGEEDGLYLPPSSGEDVVITLDPLDGTNAFVRGQSHGLATMVGVLVDGKLAGGYIGDVMTGELYMAGPGLEGVWHHEQDWTRRPLGDVDVPLAERYALLRNAPRRYGLIATRAARAWHDEEGLFEDFLVDTGSVGLHFARLWKGEVGCFAIEASVRTPWDQTPCYAISERLGIVQIALAKGRGPYLEPYAPVMAVGRTDVEYLYLHRDRLGEFSEWMRSTFPHITLEYREEEA